MDMTLPLRLITPPSFLVAVVEIDCAGPAEFQVAKFM